MPQSNPEPESSPRRFARPRDGEPAPVTQPAQERAAAPVPPVAPPPCAPARRQRQPKAESPRPKIRKLKTLEDALIANQQVAKIFSDGLMSPDDVSAYMKIMKTVVEIRRAQAVTGMIENNNLDAPDLSKIKADADIERVRPAIVVAKDFGSMTTEERREFFQKIRSTGLSDSDSLEDA